MDYFFDIRVGLPHRIFRPGLWFQEAAANIFNTCRIPQPNCDSLSPQPPPHVPNSRKLLVMVNDWTYAIEAYDENRSLLSVDIIEQRLRSVVQDATRRIQSDEKAVPVGVLSADHRDRWAKVRLTHLHGSVQQLTQFRIFNISSPSPQPMRRPSKLSNSRPSPSASTLTPSVFTHVVTHVRHAPHRPSTRPRRSTATYTIFVPRSTPETGGSIRVIPSSSRRTPARVQWANIHLAMPLYPASLPIMP